MAYSVLTTSGLTINIKAMLEAGVTIDDVNRQLRGSRGVCLQCLLARRQLTQAQAEGLDRATLESSIDSTFRCGHRRKKWDPESGGYSPKTLIVEPHYFHPEPLLNEEGDKIARPCETRSHEHVEFLNWLIGNQRAWCLNGIPASPESLLLREPRYRVDPPNWRSPDLAIVRCNAVDPTRVMEVIQRDGYIPAHAVQMVSAIEVQISRISVEEIRQRTIDHLRHFADVRWVFVERHLHGTVEARKWLAENGHEAFIIRQELDKSRILGIELLPPPGLLGKVTIPSPPLPCLRSLYVEWLAKGFAAPEALARAKGERAALKRNAEKAVSLNALLRHDFGIDLPWETSFEEVHEAHDHALADLIERQRIEAERVRREQEEADRHERERKVREQAELQERLHSLEQVRLRREEAQRQRQIEEEEFRKLEALWQPVAVVQLNRDRTMVTNVLIGDLIRRGPGGEVFVYRGRESLGYGVDRAVKTDSDSSSTMKISVIDDLSGWQVMPAADRAAR
ncbi:hypothetical protein [Cyanobium sp. Copco_Reservoir_LC18]|uniref:competence protein CoiA family protein n=1 Tax=Cyanobium sp. Copco_Reservoir_LC18 TaxID=1328305 RepID=UPI001357C3F6|nr:hypothetical protein [Cyanobium sp. Copco_Reservoir_LC18]